MPWKFGKGAKRCCAPDREVHGKFISRIIKRMGSNRSFPKEEVSSQDNNITMATVTTVTTATRRKKKTKNNKKEEEEDEV